MLKALPLEVPHPRQAMFLRLFFVALFSEFDDKTIADAFGRLTGARELELLRDSILVFFHQVCHLKHS